MYLARMAATDYPTLRSCMPSSLKRAEIIASFCFAADVNDHHLLAFLLDILIVLIFTRLVPAAVQTNLTLSSNIHIQVYCFFAPTTQYMTRTNGILVYTHIKVFASGIAFGTKQIATFLSPQRVKRGPPLQLKSRWQPFTLAK